MFLRRKVGLLYPNFFVGLAGLMRSGFINEPIFGLVRDWDVQIGENVWKHTEIKQINVVWINHRSGGTRWRIGTCGGGGFNNK